MGHETGILEGLYTIDRGTTETLIEHGIAEALLRHGSTDRPAEHVVDLIRDHGDSLKGLFDFVAGQRSLTPAYIKEIHHSLTRSQASVDAVDAAGKAVHAPLLRGAWKTQPNNPTRPDGEIHAFCPPVHVAAEVDRLVAMHAAHLAEAAPPEVEAAWLHHRFTQIHPFQDGNGRVARALASLVFVRAGWFPLVIDRDQWGQYIDALEQADRGALGELVAMFARSQRQQFLEALSLAEEVHRDQATLTARIAAVAALLRRRREAQATEYRAVFALSARLAAVAADRLQAVADAISAALRDVDPGFGARPQAATDDNRHHWKYQIGETADRFGYYANLSVHREWVGLRIQDAGVTDLVISFHGLGRDFMGVAAASAFVQRRDSDTEGGEQARGLHPACSEVFQFAYTEEPAAVLSRFERWLTEVPEVGVDQWRRQL